VTTTFSREELAAEVEVPVDRIDWLLRIGILKLRDPGPFRPSDIFRVKLVEALLKGGFTSQQVEWAVSEGHLNLDRVDEYLVVEAGRRSQRSFAEFKKGAGPRAAQLGSVYAALGLPVPDPTARIRVDEEDMMRRFLEAWRPAPADETLVRAARLIAEGTRMAAMGWVELVDEQVAVPVRERLYRGEVGRFPEEVRSAFAAVIGLLPEMMRWLMQRYLEQRSVAGIVDGFEEFFAARGLRPPPATEPPAVVFVDLSGFTRLTEEHGDEVAVDFAATLQREAESVAAANDGKLVKLLGDGAMLRFPDARRGLTAAVALVGALRADGGLPAHGGVHAGPVVERDLDLFGRTVNLASRIGEAAPPGEVLVTEAVVEAVDDPAVRFDRVDGLSLKGIPEPVPLFRAVTDEQ
jgi:adenylate cyclase